MTENGRGVGTRGAARKALSGRPGRLIGAICALLLLLGTGVALAAQEGSETPSTDPSLTAPPEQAGVELPAKRTATSDTFRLPDGSLQTKLFSTPVNYEDAAGDWKPIDADLEEAPAGGLTNVANSFDLHLPQALGDGAVRLSEGGQWFSFRLLGAGTEPAEMAGTTSIYEAADGSFQLHSLSDGVKEEITLDSPLAPAVYRFALDLSSDLEPSLQEDGSIAIKDQEGDTFATLPAPTISDASAARRPARSITPCRKEAKRGPGPSPWGPRKPGSLSPVAAGR
jgi:hypothetical protein